MKKQSLGFTIALLSLVLSVGVHIYLMNHHYDFKFGQNDDAGYCSISEKFNCDVTTGSAYSEFLNIPISIFALLLHTALALTLVYIRSPFSSAQQKEIGTHFVKAGSYFILGTSLVMATISWLVLHTICPFCSAAYGLSITLFIGIVLWRGWTLSISKSLLVWGFSAAAAILLAAYSINSNQLKKFGGKEAQEYLSLQYEEWKNAPEKEIHLQSPQQLKGTTDNIKVHIVEFADFLCGHCASAFPTLHQFAKSQNDIELSFQSFALDGECNSAIPHKTGTPCFLARVSHCAALQDKGWDVQEWLFENQRQLFQKEAAVQMLEEASKSLGFDFSELKSCADSAETQEIIKAQAQLGNELGVRGTPTIYINNKKVPSGFTRPLLNKIRMEILKGAK